MNLEGTYVLRLFGRNQRDTPRLAAYIWLVGLKRLEVQLLRNRQGDLRRRNQRALKGTAGDAANAILTAIGHNLCFVLAWLRALLLLSAMALTRCPSWAQIDFLTNDV